MRYTDEQRAILEEVCTGTENVLITALAGCTKTTTLLESLKVIPQKSILFTSFGAGIVAEAKARLPKMPRGSIVVAQTLHSLGREIIHKHFPRLAIDRDATQELVNTACETIFPGAPFEVRRSAMRIVRFAKEALEPFGPWKPGDSLLEAMAWSTELLIHVGHEYNLISPKIRSDQVIARTIAVARQAIIAGVDITQRKTIDFCDLVWLPNVLDLAAPCRYQAIMLDEVQDISPAQAALVKRLSLPNTRIIATGDEWQQLFSWRGSLGGKAFALYAPRSGKRFPLTMTWRCSKAVTEEARQLVPMLRAQPDAEDGSVSTCTLGELPLRLGQGYSEGVHTFVLSRTNVALLDCALFLWRSGTKFMLNAGRDLLDPLFALIDHELDLRNDHHFRRSLAVWHEREATKADAAGATSRREQIDEQRAMLTSALKYAPPSKIKRLLAAILVDNKSGVRLSTVHRAKGLEAERVFLLRQTFIRQEQLWIAEQLELDAAKIESAIWQAADKPIVQEELNIEYVAITRAKTHLCWVNIKQRDEPEFLVMAVAEIPSAFLDEAFCLHERAMQHAAETGDADAAERFNERIAQILKRMR